MKRILVVDDDHQITRMLRASLQSNGYLISVANSGLEGLERFRSDAPDLVVTDLAMPEMDGVELTQAIRKTSDVPIIVLSVRTTESMKVIALDEGADDYITKPFGIQELLARVRSRLRRNTSSDPVASVIVSGDFCIESDRHHVTCLGSVLHLTPKEFDLLVFLARNPGRVLTHKVLLRAIWGPAGDGNPEYLRVLVAQLRKKVEPTSGVASNDVKGQKPEPRYIRSEPWIGYYFTPDGVPDRDRDPTAFTTS